MHDDFSVNEEEMEKESFFSKLKHLFKND
jgi:hypothetical protein